MSNIFESLKRRRPFLQTSLSVSTAPFPEDLQPPSCVWEPGGQKKGTSLGPAAQGQRSRGVLVCVSSQRQVGIILNGVQYPDTLILHSKIHSQVRAAQGTEMTRDSEFARIAPLACMCPGMDAFPHGSRLQFEAFYPHGSARRAIFGNSMDMHKGTHLFASPEMMLYAFGWWTGKKEKDT